MPCVRCDRPGPQHASPEECIRVLQRLVKLREAERNDAEEERDRGRAEYQAAAALTEALDAQLRRARQAEKAMARVVLHANDFHIAVARGERRNRVVIYRRLVCALLDDDRLAVEAAIQATEHQLR